MSRALSSRSQAIRQFILDNVEDHPGDIVRFTARHFGVSRQTVLASHVNRLIEAGQLVGSDQRTRARTYHLPKNRPVARKN